jgi:hypothetical protein
MLVIVSNNDSNVRDGSISTVRNCGELVCFTPNFRHGSGHPFASRRAIVGLTRSKKISEDGQAAVLLINHIALGRRTLALSV